MAVDPTHNPQGYSGTPLWKKLGFKPGMKVAVLNSPPLSRALNEDDIRKAALACGLVDVKVCAVDADWSGLKLMRRKTQPL